MAQRRSYALWYVLLASTLTLYCYRVCVQGDNLDSVETSEIGVIVGGEECTKTLSNSSVRGSVIFCTAPLDPPGGENPAIIQVTIKLYNS